MIIIHKKQLIVLALGAILLISGLVNYKYDPDSKYTGLLNDNYGEASFVSSMKNDLIVETGDTPDDAYFVSARLEKQRAYGEQIDIQEGLLYNSQSDEVVKTSAQNEINKITGKLAKEMTIENLIKAKGFEDALAIINDDNVNVVVDSKEELNVASVSQIQNIIKTEVGTPIENIRIIQK